MATLALERETPLGVKPIAPWWHTTLLAALFLGIALAGALLQQRAAPSGALPRPSQPAALYLSMIAMQWGLILYVWKGGLRRTGVTLRELIGGRWRSARSVVLDVALALGTWAVWSAFSLAWDRWIPTGHAASVRTLLPHQPIEIALWVALSMTAGFCEELVFRGYFLRQFQALTRSTAIAVLAQAVLFGVSHGYQGVTACITITVYGLGMGILALGRGSLRPGMLAHAWTDIAAGIFRI
jgi:membrane protease YdiL (CAAX protease family)